MKFGSSSRYFTGFRPVTTHSWCCQPDVTLRCGLSPGDLRLTDESTIRCFYPAIHSNGQVGCSAMQQQIMSKYHQLEEQTLIAKKDATELGVELIERLKLISVPMGTWAGTDYIIRIRNGKLVPADTGDQGGGQM